jgi:hypothetical protein
VELTKLVSFQGPMLILRLPFSHGGHDTATTQMMEDSLWHRRQRPIMAETHANRTPSSISLAEQRTAFHIYTEAFM